MRNKRGVDLSRAARGGSDGRNSTMPVTKHTPFNTTCRVCLRSQSFGHFNTTDLLSSRVCASLNRGRSWRRCAVQYRAARIYQPVSFSRCLDIVTYGIDIIIFTINCSFPVLIASESEIKSLKQNDVTLRECRVGLSRAGNAAVRCQSVCVNRRFVAIGKIIQGPGNVKPRVPSGKTYDLKQLIISGGSPTSRMKQGTPSC